MNETKRLSVIWMARSDAAKNAVTWAALRSQRLQHSVMQLIICPESEAVCQDPSLLVAARIFNTCWTQSNESKAVRLNEAAQLIEGGFVVEIESGDHFKGGYLSTMLKEMEGAYQREGVSIGITRKHGAEALSDELTSRKPEESKGRVQVVDLSRTYECTPYFMPGTWLRREHWQKHVFREELRYEYEKEFLFRVELEERKLLFVDSLRYEYEEAREDDYVYFHGHYEKEWYLEDFDQFWLPFMDEMVETYGAVPEFIQYHLLFSLRNRMESNVNNRDKRCILPEEAEDYLWSWGRVLKYVSDESIMNHKKQRIITGNPTFKRLLLQIKHHDPDIRLQLMKGEGGLWFGYAGVCAVLQNMQGINVQYMEYVKGELLIEGTLSPLYDLEKGHFYVQIGKKSCEVTYNDRYSHTKLFGFAFTKRQAFEVRIPISQRETRQGIQFRFDQGKHKCRVALSFSSHTSRLAKVYRMCHWNFGERFMARYVGNTIVIEQVSRGKKMLTEVLLWLNMLFSLKTFQDRSYYLIVRRILYYLLRPVWGNKPVWMFIDKIYKAGDSSEYIYRYSCGKDDGITKYYLVDGKVPDCERLRKDGFEPLIRGTLKHRMMFLYADMMIISNSTVFAFNDYDMKSSAIVRDLVHFHVACVQHGMSIQKIAIAQNRLRDNTRLYFCASKYELENLNRPVYDYAGRDILKLTGVPRYDGLVNRDQRQILITPTWRMQAAMPVRQSESVQRDYNPLFKETAYYRIYNSLINDPRLLSAAKKYGYRIHYVLHPIVSPQARDFDQNPYVDIIPSTGDMSYEKEFQESSLMVSDFSGVQFDFAYMRKPVVYLHHDDIPQHYEEGTFHYDTMSFGEICHNNDQLIDVLIEYMKDDCRMKEEYRRRADDFFYYDDHNNCRRIYDVMLDYYRNTVAPVYPKD